MFNVSIAGTKDKIARTYQHISFNCNLPLQTNSTSSSSLGSVALEDGQASVQQWNQHLLHEYSHTRTKGTLQLKNVSLCEKQLYLGQLYGNRFTITLRTAHSTQGRKKENGGHETMATTSLTSSISSSISMSMFCIFYVTRRT